jgi:hypothetical protein
MQNGLLTFGFSFTQNVLIPRSFGPPPIISKSCILRISRHESQRISNRFKADAALMHLTGFL